MAEEENLPDAPENQELDSSSGEVKHNARNFLQSIWKVITETMNLREGADPANTMEGIKKDIDFKGHTVWILICSIFIASIGLNVNSYALIIGAMLISPLMGPILGVGLSVGTNDWQTLLRSLKGLGIAVAVSLVTSTIYFLITPLGGEQPELLARTKPTLLDVLVAVFGGLAGIIAGSRKEKSNVIPGVAIATALMPPLCTAGYGLATLKLNFFFGAFYLFLLNSIFISISTLLIVRYLRFPLVEFIDPLMEKKVKRYIILFVAGVILPSGYIFFNVIKESVFQTRATSFVEQNIHFQGTSIASTEIAYNDSLSTIDIFVFGKTVPPEMERDLNRRLEIEGLNNNWLISKTILRIHQSGSGEEDLAKMSQEVRTGIIEDIYVNNVELLNKKEQEILQLKYQLASYQEDTIAFDQLRKKVKVLYQGIEGFAFAKTLESRPDKIRDTIPTFLVHWDSTITDEQIIENQTKLSNGWK